MIFFLSSSNQIHQTFLFTLGPCMVVKEKQLATRLLVSGHSRMVMECRVGDHRLFLCEVKSPQVKDYQCRLCRRRIWFMVCFHSLINSTLSGMTDQSIFSAGVGGGLYVIFLWPAPLPPIHWLSIFYHPSLYSDVDDWSPSAPPENHVILPNTLRPLKVVPKSALNISDWRLQLLFRGNIL